MTRYTLHGIFASGPTYKVGLMLNLTGTPYDYVHVDLRSGAHKADAFLAKNRYGQVPVLEDHEKDMCLCQSSVILDYLADETGQFGGKDRAERLRAREWQLWGAGQLTTGIYRTRAMKLGFFTFPEQVAEANLNAANGALKELNGLLDGRDWLVGGGVTIADLDIYGIVAYAPQAQIDLGAYPHVRRWMSRVEALPRFKSVDAALPKESAKA
ncbi:MAG: glutathione S-transferase family protein [Hyphomonas oceanitis]|uniref:glutathione S-transferase family protein n=1 Tax=Hyphomonas oceanitis TaxID=81033 RepID=UPI0030027C3E